MAITLAEEKDISALVNLMDSAYRGENSKLGWTSEADLFIGERRTDEATVASIMKKPGAVFFKYVNDLGDVEGCMLLHKKDDRLYLGMFCVSPKAQGKGIGKKMLVTADEYALIQKCSIIYMTVITVREDLIAWYERNGYGRTDRVVPFPVEEKFGIPTRPLQMIVLEKKL